MRKLLSGTLTRLRGVHLNLLHTPDPAVPSEHQRKQLASRAGHETAAVVGRRNAEDGA